MLGCVLELGFHRVSSVGGSSSIVDGELMRKERGGRHFYSFLALALLPVGGC